MLFSRIEFFAFFAVILLLLHILPSNRARKLLLLGCSYYFYAYWDWRFLGLIVLSTVVDFVAGQQIHKANSVARRKVFIVLSLTVNLGLLGFFKYYGFFVESANVAFASLGLNLSSLDIILPVGISFYTFQTLSYTIDVYRGKLSPCSSFADFALFVAFFPQLVAGPIVRASTFLPQLAESRELSWERAFSGFRQFTIGLFKKVVIADNLARTVDVVFSNAGFFDSFSTWVAVIAFAVQIYCDFSGYSDMAIGVARVMGYDFGQNFNLPYISRRADEFWQRWHISLSTWLRDYLYIPLGGNRNGTTRTYINLTLTMLLGGLWHGANWTFVLWGAWHGLFLAVTKAIRGDLRREDAPAGVAHWTAADVLGWLSTMLIVLIGWVLFRAETFSDALLILRQMFFPIEGGRWVSPSVLAGIALVTGGQLVQSHGWQRLVPYRLHTPVILFSMWWLTFLLFPRQFQPFIYFQF